MKIKINKLSLFGYHGLLDKEKNEGQDFIVNISAEIKNYPEMDYTEEYTDYRRIMEKIVQVFNSKRYNLIETLANDIANKILSDKNIRFVEISIQKPNAPINHTFESVEVIGKFNND